MKIGIVCYPTFGGSGVVATELGLGLAKKGHNVHFITYRRPARLTSFHENVSYHEVGDADYPLFEYPPYDTKLCSKLVDVIKYESLDILHVHYAIPHATVAYLAQKIVLQETGKYIPFITTLHGTDITLVGSDSSFASPVQFGINRSDGITAVSEYLKSKTEEVFHVENDIRVVYNFIDFARFSKSNKDHFRRAIAPDGEKIIMHTSNFRAVKRADDVIRIFQKILAKTPAKLLMIGDGPERQNCENLCRSIGICNEIRFLGKQDAIEELLAVSDLFILPSGNESFGLAALEAMACEVPVISSNIGGLPEVNIQGVTGYMRDVGDIDGMAADALQILLNENNLAQFRQNALEQAKKFSIDNILPQYEAYYAEILDTVVHKPVV
ncbi:MAG: N-acetyl-alpha-D-glucosaminyl L-malate synthase BshA [Saprospiraceae bacterium]|nr:N-acetyl-alpha-D-glucosaminyl L-malate synthase BshA [Saprospiraceae bacterium]